MCDERVMAAISAAISFYLEDEARAAAAVAARQPEDRWKMWGRKANLQARAAWRSPNMTRGLATLWRDPSLSSR